MKYVPHIRWVLTIVLISIFPIFLLTLGLIVVCRDSFILGAIAEDCIKYCILYVLLWGFIGLTLLIKKESRV